MSASCSTGKARCAGADGLRLLLGAATLGPTTLLMGPLHRSCSPACVRWEWPRTCDRAAVCRQRRRCGIQSTVSRLRPSFQLSAEQRHLHCCVAKPSGGVVRVGKAKICRFRRGRRADVAREVTATACSPRRWCCCADDSCGRWRCDSWPRSCFHAHAGRGCWQ